MDIDLFIDCNIHGKQEKTYVCQHIAQTVFDGIPRGFYQADDPSSSRPHAWCLFCDQKLMKNKGVWDEDTVAFANVQIICGSCYDEAKELNE